MVNMVFDSINSHLPYTIKKHTNPSMDGACGRYDEMATRGGGQSFPLGEEKPGMIALLHAPGERDSRM